MSKTNELYQKVTENILSKLSSAGSWQKLWQVPTPVSLNGHHYTGINFLLLSTDEFSSPVYGTFGQIRKHGGQVKHGEKSRIVVYWDKIADTDEVTKVVSMKFFLKCYNVFNVSQADFDELGLQHIDKLAKASEAKNHLKSMSAESIIENMPNAPAIVFDKSDRASYNRGLDRVRMPEMAYFTAPDEYYSTLFHELVHSTGHKTRLNRFEAYKDFEENHLTTYSKEELVAEIGASFLASVAGLNHDLDNSIAYVAGWSKHLTEHTNWIVWAARRAELAADFVLDKIAQEVTV